MFDPEGLKIEGPKKKVDKDDDSEETKEANKAYNEQVDKYDKELEKMRSTPSGSALYNYLDKRDEVIKVEISQTIELSTVDGLNVTMAVDRPYYTIAHEMQHVVQNLNNPSGKEMSEGYNKAANKEKFFEGVREKRGNAVLPVADSSDDPSWYVEQQAMRVQNIVRAEYQIITSKPGEMTYTPEIGSAPSKRNERGNLYDWADPKYIRKGVGEWPVNNRFGGYGFNEVKQLIEQRKSAGSP